MWLNHISNMLLGIVLAYVAFTASAESSDQPGSLVVIGGTLRYDHEAVWKQVVKLAGDDAGHIVVLPAANARAKIHGGFAVRGFERYGASVELLPISIAVSDFELDYRKATADPELVGKIRGAGDASPSPQSDLRQSLNIDITEPQKKSSRQSKKSSKRDSTPFSVIAQISRNSHPAVSRLPTKAAIDTGVPGHFVDQCLRVTDATHLIIETILAGYMDPIRLRKTPPRCSPGT